MSLDVVLDERATRRIGAIAIALMATATAFFVFVSPHIEWQTPVRVRIYFADVGGLRSGAAFVVAGRDVGHVESIIPVPRGAARLLDGEIGVVVTVAIDRDTARHIRVPADVFVSSRGIVSERYLELAPADDTRSRGTSGVGGGKRSDKPSARAELRDGDELRGSDPATLDRVLERSLASMIAIRAFADDIRGEAAALRMQLGSLRAHFDQAELGTMIGNVVDLRRELDQLREVGLGGDSGMAALRRGVGEARVVIHQLRMTIDILDTRLAALRARGGSARELLGDRGGAALVKLSELTATMRGAFAKADDLLAAIDDVQARLARGEGSLAKLTTDPEFPEDMKELGKVLKRQPWKLLQTPEH